MFSKPRLACSLAILLTGCGGEKSEVSHKPTPTLKEIPTPQLRTFLKGYPGEWQSDTDLNKGIAEPPRHKPIPTGAILINLTPPEEFKIGDIPLRDALASRRSRREFAAPSLTLEEISFLLWFTQGITDQNENEAGDATQEFRTAPSGGGRFPLETNLAIHRVEGIDPGLYRYLPAEHQLLLIREDPDIPNKIAGLCYGQQFVGDAAVVFLWSAVPYRTEWKYAYLSHRMIAMEAGHICQNLYLATESLGAGACALLSYDQPGADALIGVDGTDEFVIYLACVGKLP